MIAGEGSLETWGGRGSRTQAEAVASIKREDDRGGEGGEGSRARDGWSELPESLFLPSRTISILMCYLMGMEAGPQERTFSAL